MAVTVRCGKCGNEAPAHEQTVATWTLPNGWLVLRAMPTIKLVTLCPTCVSDLEKWLGRGKP